MEHLQESSQLSDLFIKLNDLVENIRNLKVRESNAQLLKQQAELEALQAQINPHFLYNTLDCIRGQAIHYGMADIEIMARSLSKIFRYSISNHDSVVSLEEELANIDSYLLIQQMRFNNKFVTHKNIEDEAYSCSIPKLIIQSIVENAIHHGLETKEGIGSISIEAFITDNRLIVNIIDDGIGITLKRLEEINCALATDTPLQKANKAHTSIGLVNVNSRIKLIFGKEYGINIYSAENSGTTVQINLPRIYNR